jgi:aldose 1-epimerase
VIAPRPPSGQQYELVHGDQRAVVVEVGAGLRLYEAGGRPLLDSYAENEMCKSGRGQVLIPWPNRIADGSYEFDGTTYQLALTEPEAHNAIHGLVRWRQWSAREKESNRVVMEHVLNPQPGYPFTLELTIEYALSDAGLSVHTTARNAGDAPCPFGAGAHPYLTLETEPVDSLRLRVPAATVLASDDRGSPTGSSPVAGSDYDFRAPREIGTTVLDHAFTDLDRDADGMARATLADDSQGRAVELWVDGSHSHLMVFTGDPLPEVNRRAVAIEPMTCPPNAFRTGDGVMRLDPAESVSLRWGLGPHFPTTA